VRVFMDVLPLGSLRRHDQISAGPSASGDQE
jgi:hypothetical protein